MPHTPPRKRKLRAGAPKPAGKPAPKVRRKPQPAALDRARADAMVLIERQRGLGDDANVFLDKAHLLLTRHWAKSGWTARGELIKTADWLIRVAAANPGPGAVSAAPQRKR